MRLIGLLSLLILLSGCSQANTDSPPSEPIQEPASAPAHTLAQTLHGVALDTPLSLVGTEPFWGVTITPSNITLKRPDHADIIVPAIPFAVTADEAHLTSQDLTLSLSAARCSDGMSDRIYPLTAQTVIKGETLKGCAIPTADLTAVKP